MTSQLARAVNWYAYRLMPRAVRERLDLLRAMKAEPLLEALAPLVDPTKTAIDIGANIGTFTLFFKRTARNVIAFEPIPHLAERLRKRFNGAVDVIEIALSNKKERTTLYVPCKEERAIETRASLNQNANDGFSLTSISVDVDTLDSYGYADIGIIKIDVEGHEQETIRGARETIERSRPILVVEIEERHHVGRSWDIIRYIEGLGYDAFFSRGTQLHPVASFDFATMQNLENLKDPFKADAGLYLNNFVFLPHGAARPA